MKLTKRMLSLLLTVVMVLSMIPAVYAAGEAATEETWTPNPSQTYAVDGDWIEISTGAELHSLLANGSGKDPKSINIPENEGKTIGIRLTADIATKRDKTEAPASFYIGYYSDTAANCFPVNIVLDLNGHTMTDTSNNYRLFGIYSGSHLTITNGTLIASGNYTSTGGVFFTHSGADLTLDGMKLINNASKDTYNADGTGDDGGVYFSGASGCKLNVINSWVEATGSIRGRGGILCLDAGTHNITNSVIKGGKVVSQAADENAHGGNIYVGGATLTITDSTITDGQVLGCNVRGGNIYATGSKSNITLNNSTIENGIAQQPQDLETTTDCALGGNIYLLSGAQVTMNGGTVTGGQVIAKNNGGSGYSGGGNIAQGHSTQFTLNSGTISNGTCCNNQAAESTYVVGGNVFLYGVSGNTTTKRASFIMNGGTVTDGMNVGGASGNNGKRRGGNFGMVTYAYLEINGGTVSNGTAYRGANIDVTSTNCGILMTGGTITGGTVGVTSGTNSASVFYQCRFIMTGGTIEKGNSNAYYGMIITNVSAGRFYMYGGTIEGYKRPLYRTGTSYDNAYLVEGAVQNYNGTTEGKFVISPCTETTVDADNYTIFRHVEDESKSTVTQAATCETAGQLTITCTDCDYSIGSTNTSYAVHGSWGGNYIHEIPALGHDYEGSQTKAPTCTADGEMTYVCKNDATHTYTEAIPASGTHTPGTPVIENEVANSCTAEGSYDTVVYCEVCNAEISRETTTVPADRKSVV